MNDTEYVPRRTWTWVLGIAGAMILTLFIGMLLSGRPAPGWLRAAPLDELKALYERRPHDSEVAYYYAQALNRDEHTDRAYEIMEDVVRREPRSTRYLWRLANYAGMQGHARETVDLYRRLIALNPRDADAHERLGHIYTEAGLLDDGLSNYDAAVQLNPRIQLDAAHYAKCLIHAARYEEAWSQLETSLESVPLQDSPYELLTQAGIKLKKFDEVQVWLSRRMQMDRVYPLNRYYYCLAQLAYARPRTAASLKDAEVWAFASTQDRQGTKEQHPVQPENCAFLGQIRLQQGRKALARDAIQEGLKIDPKNKECLDAMVKLCEASNDPSASMWRSKYLKSIGETAQIAKERRAVEADPHNSAAITSLAAALERSARYEEAADLCHKVLAASPGDQTAQAVLERCQLDALTRLEADAKLRYRDLRAGS